MSKKIFLILLIPGLLVIGAYIALQVYLRTGTSGNQEAKQEQMSSTQRSEAQGNKASKKATTGAAAKKETNPEEDKEHSETAVNPGNKATDGEEKTSPFDLSRLFVEKLQDLVQKSSGGLYQLSVGDLDVDILASTVSLHRVALRPDEQKVQQLKEAGRLPQSVVSLRFDDLLIDGINLDDAISSKTMDYKTIRLHNPVVEIDSYRAGNDGGGEGDFSQGFLQQMEKLAIEQLQVEGGTVTLNNKTKGKTQKLENVQILLEDILLNEATRTDKNRFLFAKQAQFSFRDFAMETAGGLYKLKIGEALVNATQHRLELKNIRYSSPLSKEEFVAKQKNATEKYDLSLPLVTASGVDWLPAFNGEAVSAGEVAIKGGDVAVYFNRSLPPQNKMGSFPNQLLEKLSVPVAVEKVSVEDLSLSYEEFNPVSAQSGTIYLDDVAMGINNIANKEANSQPLTVDGSALFMKKVPLTASFTFPMEKAAEGAFSATLRLDSFEAAVMNPVARPLGLVMAERGMVHRVDVRMQGHEKAASGEVLLLYDKLRLSILKKNEESKKLQKRHLFSFLANLLAIKNDNPWWLTGKKRKKQAYFERDPEAGFMNLVWKTALVGLLKTVGAPEKKAKKK